MSPREQTVSDAIQLFDSAAYPSGLSAATAWLGIYQTLLWYEPINWVGFDKLPHIIDADKLRPASRIKKRSWKKPNAWQRRANKINAYLAERLGCSKGEVSTNTDLLMKRLSYRGMQRQNPLGIAFPGLVKHILEKFGSPGISYETEVDAATIFPGIGVPGRSTTPSIDLLVRIEGIPQVIISAKWSLRHDRLNDITNECPVYKAAYQRIYRQARRSELLYFLITNEYDPARVNKVLTDTCVNGIVHVHKPAVVGVCELNGRMGELKDLQDFIKETSSWL
jgi:hypothetical protein